VVTQGAQPLREPVGPSPDLERLLPPHGVEGLSAIDPRRLEMDAADVPSAKARHPAHASLRDGRRRIRPPASKRTRPLAAGRPAESRPTIASYGSRPGPGSRTRRSPR